MPEKVCRRPAWSSTLTRRRNSYATVLSTLGGVIGICLGLVGSYFAANAMSLPFVLAPDIVALSFVFSALVGVVFGYLPARKAAKLDPIEALRHE